MPFILLVKPHSNPMDWFQEKILTGNHVFFTIIQLNLKPETMILYYQYPGILTGNHAFFLFSHHPGSTASWTPGRFHLLLVAVDLFSRVGLGRFHVGHKKGGFTKKIEDMEVSIYDFYSLIG